MQIFLKIISNEDKKASNFIKNGALKIIVKVMKKNSELTNFCIDILFEITKFNKENSFEEFTILSKILRNIDGSFYQKFPKLNEICQILFTNNSNIKLNN